MLRGHARCDATPSARRPLARRTYDRALWQPLSAVSRRSLDNTGHCGRVILPTMTDMKNPTDMLHSRHTLCDVVEGTGV